MPGGTRGVLFHEVKRMDLIGWVITLLLVSVVLIILFGIFGIFFYDKAAAGAKSAFAAVEQIKGGVKKR